jgi:hypothetical protein
MVRVQQKVLSLLTCVIQGKKSKTLSINEKWIHQERFSFLLLFLLKAENKLTTLSRLSFFLSFQSSTSYLLLAGLLPLFVVIPINRDA